MRDAGEGGQRGLGLGRVQQVGRDMPHARQRGFLAPGNRHDIPGRVARQMLHERVAHDAVRSGDQRCPLHVVLRPGRRVTCPRPAGGRRWSTAPCG
ncbi:Uncharacterised protein [Bordetella pertussis]|nr:Uncharacterised protein [Bordetella pertussis]